MNFSSPTIEAVLTLQAPCVFVVSLVCARSLRSQPGEPDDPGLRILRFVFYAMATLWLHQLEPSEAHTKSIRDDLEVLKDVVDGFKANR